MITLFAWMFLFFLISILLAYHSLRKERQRHEIDKAKKEMTTGRVIFHSSSEDEHKGV